MGSHPDPLSDVLRAIDLQGAVFFAVEAAAPWVAAAPPAAQIAGHVHPGAQHVIEFHAVVAGSAFLSCGGAAPVRLDAGDVVLLPHGDAHALASTPDLTGEPDLPFFASLQTANLPIALRLGAPTGPPAARLVCGFLACAVRPFNPLVAALPRLLHDRAADAADRGYVRTFVERAAAESQRQALGSQCVLTRLSELMFIEVVRRHLARLGPEATGWLGALRDPVVGRAIELLHRRPGRPWTLEQLAAEAAASRTVLAERFRERVGMPPMQYLTHWRMQLACRWLEHGHDGLARIAAEVGYASEAAFQRAFKQVVGCPPGAWRRQRRAAAEYSRPGAQSAPHDDA